MYAMAEILNMIKIIISQKEVFRTLNERSIQTKPSILLNFVLKSVLDHRLP